MALKMRGRISKINAASKRQSAELGRGVGDNTARGRFSGGESSSSGGLVEVCEGI